MDRSLAGREELAERVGLSTAMLALLYAERTVNGHPAPASKVGNTLYWDEEEWRTWYARHKQAQDEQWRSEVDRSGNGDDEVTLAQAARVLGMEPTSITKYPTRPPRHWPEPVRTETTKTGRTKRFYRRADIWAYADKRERGSGGRPAGSTERRFAYDGDPRLQQARTALEAHLEETIAELGGRLAREHGGSASTWAHIVASARQHPEEG